MKRPLRWLLALIFSFNSSASTFAQSPAKDRLVDGIERGLTFLALMQEKDGEWRGQDIANPAISSLAVLAFLSAGHVPGEGPYKAHVDKGIRWILKQQQANGLFGAPGQEDNMYQHGICTMMLCEVVAMSDAKTAKEMKPKLEKAVQMILQAQRTDRSANRGGWRYQLASDDADMSVSGWQILALRAAKNIGCDIPADRIELALKFVEACRHKSGGYGYLPGSAPTLSCTGTGILALELCGKERHHSREALLAGSYLLEHQLTPIDPRFYYAAYYTSQAMFQLGGNYWTIHRTELHKLLLGSQQQNGGWLSNDKLGVSYNTAMAILALTVEYRLLPLYQRDEESETKPRK